METKSVKPSNNIKSRKRTNNNTSGRNAVVKAMDGVQNSGDQNLISALARSASDDRLHHSSSGSDGCSHDSSSNAYAEPPSLNSIAGDMEDIADVMSELSETEDMQYKLNSMAQEWSQENSLELEKLIKLAAQKDGFVSGPVSPAELADPLSQKHIDPETEHRLQLLLEAAGVSKLTSTDGKAFADPEVLRKLTSSVSVALDEAAAALTRMRAEQQNLDHEPVRSLADACADGDLEAVKRLLSDGRSVHETTEDGDSLLCIACSKGYYELAELLLLMKANVEDRGCKNDLTPLMEAASGGYVDIVKLLINYDADVNAFSTAGHTALHHAAVGGFEEVVHLLIVSGANVEEQNENGHTPLMEAASAGHVGVAKILLDAGAGINTHSNEFKESALTLACYKGHLEMVKFLLDAGADQEHKTDEMHTALMEASMDGHVEVARLLLDSGAQVNMPADSFESPLTLAACGGHVELANLLIDRGANLEEVNDEGYTPLMEAAREGHEEMVALLLAHDAEVNAQTEEMQETALTLSCCGGFLEVAHFLIRASADIELGCSTPLMEAAQEGHIELTKYLIRQGANVHANTQTGDTALTYACENGHTDVADVLLQAGAELEHESEGGRTPLMKAARAGHVCTVNFLISKGANVNAATTNHDHTVLSLACAGGHLQVVETLLKHNADPMIKLKDGSTMVIEAAKGGHTNVVNALLDFPQTVYKTIASSVSSEYPDSIPMADDMPPDPTVPKELKNTETLAARLEGFIHKMMCQAENLSGTREEQMAKKQEILEELQRVEQELKIRTLQAQENQSIVNIDNIADGMQDLSQTSFDSIPPPPASPMLEGSECYEGQEELMMGLTEQHEYVEQSLQKTLKEQQSHQLHLQQQKQFYQQERLQTLKQQYQQKQHQLQQHRQQLLSQAANSSTTCVNPPSNGTPGQEADGESCERNRQPIPLHIALQNHLQAHHVTEGNVSDLAQALQDWDTRDRNNIIINHSQLKPMPTFNLAPLPAPDGTAAPTNEIPPSAESPTEEPLPLELPEPMVEAPPSRSLADALSTLIQAADSPHNNTQFDKELERVIGDTRGNDLEKMETLEWLKSMEPELGPLVEQQQYQMLKKNNNQTVPGKAVPVPKQATTRKLYNNNDKLNSNAVGAVGAGQIKHITKVPNTAINNHQCSGGKGDGMSQSLFTQPPQPPRSSSPARVPGGSGVDPNAETDSNHDTALTLACAGGHAELVRLLLSRNAVIEHRDKKGFTPLILAATAGHAEVVEILAEHNADIEAQSERTKDTPLSLACSGGRYEVVEILLKLGANKEHRNVSDYTPLSLAASGGYVNIIKLLLSYGAEINSRTGSKLGISPLMLAAMNGHSSAVKLLLDMGSDINAQIETNKNTALTLACFQGRHEVVNFLVDRKANIEHRAKTGLTPLMEAASGGYVEVGRVLLDKHADVNAPPVPSSRDTALTIAADKGHYRFVELLLARGAIVDVKNKKGNSPLWLACNGGHLDVVQKLVSCGADIDSQDNRRVSCLMTSFRKGHIKVVKWLVRNVTQFPGDKELVRYIKTLEEKTEKSDKEVLRKCKSCMEIITHAKECQLREANKNATILLEQIESEKSREEKRKQAAARKRDKKKQQRKKKQQENNPDEQCSETPERSPTPEEPEISEQTIENEERTITNEETTTSANSITDIKGARVNRNQNNIVQPDEVENKENRGNARNRRNKKNSKTSKTVHEINQTNREKTSEQHAHNSRISDLDDFNEPPIQNSISRGPTRNKRSNMTNGGDYSEPKTRSKTVNPSPGKKKREDGWKEVPTRKQKRVHIPAAQVSLVYEELENIRKESGAHIEIENSDISPRKSNGDRFIIVRGSADSTKTACSRVSDILKNNELVHIVGSSKQKSAVWNRSEHAPSLNGAADSQSSLKFADFFAGLPSEQKPKPASAKTTVTAGSASRNQPAWGRSNSKPAPALQTAAIVKPTVRVPTPAAVPVVIPPSPKANAVRKLFAPPAVSQPPVSAVEPMHAPSPVQAVQKSPPQPIGPPPVIVHTSVHNAVNTGVHGAIERPVSSTVNRAVTRPISRTSTAPIKPDFHPVNSFEPFRQQPISLPNMIPTGYDPELPTGYPEMSTGYPEEKFSKAPGHKPNLSPGSQLGMSSGPSRFTPTSDHNASFSRNVTHASQSPFEETPRSLMSGPFGETQYLSNSLPASGFTDRPGFASGDMTLDQEKRYTSTKNPLTLPRHMPMLNPNASEFTASQFGSRGDVMSQGSPRAQKAQMSPGFVSAPSPQNVEQELYGGKSIMYPHQSGTPPAKMNPAFQTNRGNMYSPAKSGLSPPAGNVSPKNVDMMRQQSMFTEKRQPQYGPLFTGPPIQQPQYNSNQNVWGSSWQAGFNHPIMNDQFSGMNGRFDSASLFATDTSYGGQFGLTDPPPVLAPFPNAPYSGMQYNTMGAGDASNMLQGAAWGAPVTNNVNNSPFSQDWNGGFDNQPQ